MSRRTNPHRRLEALTDRVMSAALRSISRKHSECPKLSDLARAYIISMVDDPETGEPKSDEQRGAAVIEFLTTRRAHVQGCRECRASGVEQLRVSIPKILADA